MTTLEQALRSAARIYAECGLAAHPLVRDLDGFVKKPLFENGVAWLKFTAADNEAHPCHEAAGIGLILGAASGAGCIDVDDPGLADGLLRHFETQAAPPLMQRTVRNGLHILVVEPEPSISVDLEIAGTSPPSRG